VNHVERFEQRQLFSNLSPLSVGSAGYSLVDDQNRPVFISGDAGWSIMTGVNRNDADLYMAKRVSKGMNFMLVNVIEARFNGPDNDEGQLPFNNNQLFTSPNERYWQNVDYVLARADELGMYVFLFPAYLGFAGSQDGWYEQLIDAGTDSAYRYGRFLGDRYESFDNIIWTMGGDRNVDEASSVTDALVSGIKDAGAPQHFTAHAALNTPGARTYNRPWLDFNNSYAYQFSYQRVREDKVERPDLATFLIEDNYENRAGTDQQTQRRQKYWAVLSGASGALMGNFPLWQFGTRWRDQLDSRLAFDMKRLREFFTARNWAGLRPDWDRQYLTRGIGNYGQDNFVTTAATADRTLMVSYLPTSRKVEIKLSKFSSPVFAKWFDPSTARMINIWDGTRSNSGRVTVAPPKFNDNNATDWVLVVETDLRGNKPNASRAPTAAGKPRLDLQGNAVRISWQDNSQNELGVRVQRRQRGQSSFRTIADLGTESVVWIDRTASRGITYDYRIVSSNVAGERRSESSRIFVGGGLRAGFFSSTPITTSIKIDRQNNDLLA